MERSSDGFVNTGVRIPEEPSDQAFRMMVDASPQLAWVAEPDGSIFWFNKRWYAYTGTTLESMQGWGWRSVHDPALVDGVESRFREAIRNGQAWEDTFRLRAADGSFRWFLSRAEPIRDDVGAIVRWFGTNTDVHDFKLGQDRLQAAIDAVQGVLWTNDAEGRMTGEQPGWSALTGQSREAYEGFGWADTVHADDAQPTIDAWNVAVAERRPFVFEHRVRLADGGFGAFAIRAIPILEGDGLIREWVGVHADISAQRSAEAALRASNSEMQRYTHMVSHDLRAPLVNVMGFTAELTALRDDLFPSEADSNPAVRADFDEALHFIRRSTERMDRLLSAILQLAREGQRKLNPVDLDLNGIVRQILDGQQHQIAEADAHIVVEDLPRIVADRAATEQVLANLIDNALKYRAADRRPEVRISARSSGSDTRITVADNGRGISETDQTRAFQLFRRVGVQTVSGEGVGLAYVEALTRAMGGGIELQSQLGVGSRFTVRLPQVSPQAKPGG